MPSNLSFPVYSLATEATTTVFNNLTNDGADNLIKLRYNHTITVAIICVTGLLSLTCILGNSLVICAVLLVHKLKSTPYYYLIVSLAVSDLLVGMIVMPLAIVPDVLDAWPLGKDMCAFWVTSDVTLCTASILNLMMISIDRYLIITIPYKYGRHRTGKLMLVYITIAWVVSLLISTTPLFVEWLPEYGPNNTMCRVNQEIQYQMYATVVSFYVPVVVMIILYGRIYCLSKKLSRADAKNAPRINNNNNHDTASYQSSGNDSPLTEFKNSVGKKKRRETIAIGLTSVQTLPVSSTLSIPIDHHVIDEAIVEDSSAPSGETDWLRANEHHHNLTTSDKNHHNHNHHTINGHHHHHHHHHLRLHDHWPLKKLSQVTIASIKKFLHIHHKPTNTRAIKTLGIIMGMFLICWVPFFVLALLSPICDRYCPTFNDVIPHQVHSAFLWIGYVNSFFNPIIYARFNTEFRTPFKEILCCRCCKINESVRHSDYLDKYGDPGEVS